MRIIVEIFLLSGLCFGLLDAGYYCYGKDDHPNRNYSTKTAYVSPPNGESFRDKPEDCLPQHIWLLARHGTRYVSGEEMTKIEQFLTQLRQDIMDNLVDGSLCTDDIRQLRSWTFRMQPEQSMALSPTGWSEVEGLGSRLAEHFPSILGVRYDENDFELRHSNYTGKGERMRDSARAFASGAFGFYEGVRLVEQARPDWLIHYYKNCDRYVQEVSSQRVNEYELFKQSNLTRNMIRELELRLGFNESDLTFDKVDLLYDVCRVEYGVYGDSPWCTMFTGEGLRLMEYGEDVKYYWSDGYGSPINYRQACPLVRDLVDNLRAAVNNTGKKFAGRFGHSVNLNTFLARLGLFRESEHLRGGNYHKQHERHWRTTTMARMTGNVAVVLYKCGTEYSIQVYLNEKLVQLPGCESLCPIQRFYDLYAEIAKSCDVEEMCKPVEAETEEHTSSGCGMVSVSFLLLVLAFLFS